MSKHCFCLLTCLYVFSVFAGEYLPAKRVQHDPFLKPAIPQQSDLTPGESPSPAQQVIWAPKLSATLRAGRNSMANVNGNIIRLGESLDGYQLIEVDERSAVFVKNKQRTQLKIDDEATK